MSRISHSGTSAWFAALLVSLVVAAPVQAQRTAPPVVTTPEAPSRGPARRSRPWEGLTVSTTINAKINGRTYTSTVDGLCQFDQSSTPANAREQWSVVYPPPLTLPVPEPPLTFTLSVWTAPAGRAIPFFFRIQADGKTSFIQTYLRPSGSGVIHIKPDGTHAHFEISGKDSDGRPLSASIECSKVREPVAAGD